MKYLASLINNASIVQRIEFEADTQLKAWVIANDGIDPLAGVWVDVRPVIEPALPVEIPKPAANPEKNDAQLKSFSIDRSNPPNALSCALPLIPNAAGYTPAITWNEESDQ